MDATIPSYAALLAVKYASRALYDIREEWVGHVPADPWDGVRLIAVLHHTSLAEGIYLAVVPNRVLRKIAGHAVLPVAKETMEKPIEGRIFKLMVPNAVSITRKRDQSWTRVLEGIDDPDAMVALFPEGRMMRPNGLDKTGQPMTVKPGIAEVLRALGHGRMVLAYSGGLHHVFRPGAARPRLFKTLHLRLESVDIEAYVDARMRERPSFRDAVVQDLTHRRDLYTPIAPGTPAEVSAEVVRRRYRRWAGHRLEPEEDDTQPDPGARRPIRESGSAGVSVPERHPGSAPSSPASDLDG